MAYGVTMTRRARQRDRKLTERMRPEGATEPEDDLLLSRVDAERMRHARRRSGAVVTLLLIVAAAAAAVVLFVA